VGGDKKDGINEEKRGNKCRQTLLITRRRNASQKIITRRKAKAKKPGKNSKGSNCKNKGARKSLNRLKPENLVEVGIRQKKCRGNSRIEKKECKSKNQGVQTAAEEGNLRGVKSAHRM